MSTISPHKPEDWPRQFVEHLNGGDLDAIMSLYEPEARFVTHSGETLVGCDAIRKVLGGRIEAKTQFQSRVVRTVIVGDTAQLYIDFEGTTVDDARKSVPVRSKTIRSSAPPTRRPREANTGRSKRTRMKIAMQAYRLAKTTPLAILLSDSLALRAKSAAQAGPRHRSRQTSCRFVCRMFARTRRLAAR
jgi:hypothetical protein